VHLSVHSITASECISKLTQSWRPISHNHRFQSRSITASNYIPEFTQSLPQDHLQICSITASKYISMFTQSRCDETALFSRHPKGIGENERFWLNERRTRLRGYEVVPGWEEPHKLRGSMNARPACVRPRSGKDRLCISYNEIVYLAWRLPKIYSPLLSPSPLSWFPSMPPSGFP